MAYWEIREALDMSSAHMKSKKGGHCIVIVYSSHRSISRSMRSSPSLPHRTPFSTSSQSIGTLSWQTKSQTVAKNAKWKSVKDRPAISVRRDGQTSGASNSRPLLGVRMKDVTRLEKHGLHLVDLSTSQRKEPNGTNAGEHIFERTLQRDRSRAGSSFHAILFPAHISRRLTGK